MKKKEIEIGVAVSILVLAALIALAFFLGRKSGKNDTVGITAAKIQQEQTSDSKKLQTLASLEASTVGSPQPTRQQQLDRLKSLAASSKAKK